MFAVRRELRRVTLRQTGDMACELDDGDLHAEADSEVRNAQFACGADRLYHAFNSTHAEPTRHQQAVELAEQRACRLVIREAIAGHPRDVDARVMRDAAMDQRLLHTLVAVDEVRVLAHHGNAHAARRFRDAAHDLAPRGQIRLTGFRQPEPGHHARVETLLAKRQRDLVDGRYVAALDHVSEVHVAEQGDLALRVVVEGTFGAADQHVGLDADLHQLAHGVLRRLGLHLAGGGDVRHQREMHEHRVRLAHFSAELTDRFKKRQ